MLQVNGSTLQQVEKFKYLGVVFTSDGRRKEEIDKWIGKVNAVLRELYRSVVTKQDFSKTAKLSVCKSVFVPTFEPKAFGSKYTVLKKKLATLFGLFGDPQSPVIRRSGLVPPIPPRYTPDVTLCDKVRSCEIRRALNVEPLLRIGRSQLCRFGHVSRMPHERLARQVLLAEPTRKPPIDRPRPRWSDCISGPAWSRVGVDPVKLFEIVVDREVFQVLLEMLPPQPSLEAKWA